MGEWKIKYGKYKTLSQPSKCVQCAEKRVKFAYHTRCEPCVEESGKCSKCGEKEEFVATPELSKEQQAKIEAEFQKELKMLPERRRRTFQRYLEKQQKGVIREDVKEGEEPIKLTPEEVMENAKVKLHVMRDKFSKNMDDFDLNDSDASVEDTDED